MTIMKKSDDGTDGFDKTDGFKERTELNLDGAQDLELENALKDFRSSMHAWSDAAYNRPRSLAQPARRKSWRLAASWAMGCLLVTGTLSGGLIERHHRNEMARIAAAQQEKQLRDQDAQAKVEAPAKITDEDLLADVDSAVSRQVPSAMEPLAQLMTEDETK